MSILLVSNPNFTVSERLIKSPQGIGGRALNPTQFCVLSNYAVFPQNKIFLVTFTKQSKIICESKTVKIYIYLKLCNQCVS